MSTGDKPGIDGIMAKKRVQSPPPATPAPAPAGDPASNLESSPVPASKAPAAVKKTKGKSKASAGGGRHLVIVESPTKAKTINKYLGPDYLVMASVGHVRDLPERAPKGSKQPVPGVDVEHDFKPTYEVLPAKRKTVADLKKAARNAADVWFATDLDREGEAIAWHLAQALEVPVASAKRVVFNAITRGEIQHAFSNPRHIDESKVNAQQARRILDRLVGYQVSPLLWKKVAGGLSAGRVQSVAVRLVVEREREIEGFIPHEYWRVAGYFTPDLAAAPELRQAWMTFLDTASPPAAPESNGNGDTAGSEDDRLAARTLKQKIAWLNQHRGIRAELVELAGAAMSVEVEGKDATILQDRDKALQAARSLGFTLDQEQSSQDPRAKGDARFVCVYKGHLDPAAAPKFSVASIQTRRTTSRPGAPFITSTLQQQASTQLGFALQRTMRIAQQLYEGVDLKGYGQVGLITYMRTDSTHLSGEALSMARDYIGKTFGPDYLPEKPNFFASSNKAAQEAHEAIRPTDVTLAPSLVRASLSEEQFKLYRLIWERFVACQMTSAQWDSTTVNIAARDASGASLATFRATGRTLVFDGQYKVTGIPGEGDEPILPALQSDQPLAPLHVDPTQHFTSPPPRYTEASLQKKLEEEGIGRPSTYAAIISTIQDRKYVEQMGPRDRRLRASDLAKVVTDKLMEAFPQIMDVGYTREMEAELDKIEEDHHDWVTMLRDFYGPFRDNLARAHEEMRHAKAETEPAPFTCAKCGAPTVYRFGRNGRFLSCSRYPDCDYAAPIDRDGQPVGEEKTDIACPICGGEMTRRSGRFGPFLGCVNYPKCKGIVKLEPKKGTIVLPKAPPLLTDLPCPKCDSPLNLRRSKRGPWLSCSKYPKCRGRLGWTTLEPAKQTALEQALAKHEHDNPVPDVRTREGQIIGEDYVPQIVSSTAPTPIAPGSAPGTTPGNASGDASAA